MMTSERKTMLLARLRSEGRIVAKDIADEFGLSEDTLRRDLRELAAEGKLRRVHGGALPLQPDLPDFAARKLRAPSEKEELGAAAARLIRPGQMVFLDGGTTNAALARALPRDFAFTVVTHSPTIAGELEHHPTAEIVLIGGRIYKHSMVATGTVAAAQIAHLRPDIFFLGVTGIHPVHGFTTGDFEEAAIKRLISGRSSETWILATREKLDVASPVSVISVTEATGMVISAEESETKAYQDAGIQIWGSENV